MRQKKVYTFSDVSLFQILKEMYTLGAVSEKCPQFRGRGAPWYTNVCIY